MLTFNSDFYAGTQSTKHKACLAGRLLAIFTLSTFSFYLSATETTPGTVPEPPSMQALKISTIRVEVAPAERDRLSLLEEKGDMWVTTSTQTEPPMERITVTGQRPDGSTIGVSFFGGMFKDAIRDALMALIADMLSKYSQEYIEEEDLNETVCEIIQERTPSYCYDFSAITSNPFNPGNWQFPPNANGCGAGGILEALGFHIVRNEHGWQDDINEPIPGRSFRSACNNHDICYSNQVDRLSCDSQFKSEMDLVCDGFSGDKCNLAAGAYHFAVRGESAGSAYMKAGKANYCKRIQRESAANFCH